MTSLRDPPLPDDFLERARSGDEAAERELFRSLHARILAVAKRRTGNEQAAEDLAQEALATISEKYRDAVMPGGLLPWVFTILHHKVGNYLKKRRTERAHQPALAEVRWSGALGAGDFTDEIALEDTLVRALAACSPECRKIFTLLLGGATRSEIQAAFENEPSGTVDSRVSRCRERLLRELARLGSEKR